MARRSGDYAMAGVVARARLDGGRVHEPRFVFFGVGDTPVVATGAAAASAGKALDAVTLKAAQQALDTDLDPPTDQHGGPAMKRQLARTILARALARLVDRQEERRA